MNRIEEKMNQLKKNGKKAFITYMTAGLPDMEGCKKLIHAQEKAGLDVLKHRYPVFGSDGGWACDSGGLLSIHIKGNESEKVFKLVKEVRKEGCGLPIVFMMYFNTILHYGLAEFAEECKSAGVDGLIVPDLPFEEQFQLREVLEKDEAYPIILQLVAPVSGKRLPMVLERARGFVYCVSSMGVTGQSADFHKNILNYLKEVKRYSKVPVMMGFGIRTPEDVEPMKEVIDGCIVGSHFIRLMEESGYAPDKAEEYCASFKTELNAG